MCNPLLYSVCITPDTQSINIIFTDLQILSVEMPQKFQDEAKSPKDQVDESVQESGRQRTGLGEFSIVEVVFCIESCNPVKTFTLRVPNPKLVNFPKLETG